MLKAPNITSKKSPTPKKYNLAIYDIEFSAEVRRMYSRFSFAVYGLDDALIKESPIFYGSTHQTWEIFVDLGKPRIGIFWVGGRGKEELGSVCLEMNKNHATVNSPQNKPICNLNYSLTHPPKSPPESQKYPNLNFDNIFQQKPLKAHTKVHHPTLDITYQRKAFYEPDTKIIQLSAEEGEDGHKTRKDLEEERTVMRKVGEASRILDQSMRKAEEERRLFSKYLDQSTSYINQLMHQLDQKSMIDNSNFKDISAIKQQKNESEEQSATQQKWYKNKFHKTYIKQKSKLHKPKSLKSPQQNPQKILLDFLQPSQPTPKTTMKMISDIIIQSKNKVKEIIISGQEQEQEQDSRNGNGKKMKMRDFVRVRKEDGKGSNSWPVQIPLPLARGMGVRCVCGEVQLLGCIGGKEEKAGQCELFDHQGISKGIMSFKCKLVCQTVIQTQDLLPQQIQVKQQKQQKIIPINPRSPSKLSRNTQPIKQQSEQKQEQPVNQKDPSHSEPLIRSKIEKSDQIEIVNEVKQQPMEANLNSPIFYKTEKSGSPEIMGKDSLSMNGLSPIKHIQQAPVSEIQHLQIDTENEQKVGGGKNFRKYTEIQPKNSKSGLDGQNYPSLMPRSATAHQNPQNLRIKHEQTQTVENDAEGSQRKVFDFDKLRSNQNQQTANQKSQRLYESEAINLNLFSPRQKKINLKIISIDVRLEQPNHNGKFMKIQMSTQPIPFYTETSKQVYFLNWKGKGYLFINIPQVSILTLSLVEEVSGTTNVLGSCKIHLNLLNSQFLGVNSYEDYLRNQNEESIGKVILEFEFFQKNQNDLKSLNTNPNSARKSVKKRKDSSNKTPSKQQSQRYKNLFSRLVQSTVQRQKPKLHERHKSSNIRIKTESSRPTFLKNIELHDKIFDRIQKDTNKSTVKVRKYVGGNIIIPKAARFKTEHTESVGPGTYEYESQFHRHAIPQ